MQTKVGTYDSGMIFIDSDANTTTVRVRWPFDRQTDEWIVLTVELNNSDIRGRGDSVETGTSNSLTLSDHGDHAILGARGSNSLGPVQLDCVISQNYASELRRHLAAV